MQLKPGAKNQQQGSQHHQRSRNALRVKKIGDDDETGKKDQQGGVACCAQFKQLQGNQNDQQCHAGLSSEQCVVTDLYPCDDGDRDTEQQPARRQRVVTVGQINSPGQYHRTENADPLRQMLGVGRDHQKYTGDHTIEQVCGEFHDCPLPTLRATLSRKRERGLRGVPLPLVGEGLGRGAGSLVTPNKASARRHSV